MQSSTEAAGVRPFPMSFDFGTGQVRLEGEGVDGECFFGADALLFAGHFPSNKILPGVVLVEYALYLGERYLRARGDDRRLTEIANVVFLAPVVPDTTVRCRCEFADGADGALTMKAVLSRGEVVCAKAKVRYARR